MVFILSVSIVALFVLWGFLYPTNLAATSASLLSITTEKFGWFYLATVFFILGFSVFLAFSKYGSIRFGKDDDQPQYTNISWFAMLFSAGMGIGLLFWGIAEPLQHYLDPPLGIEGGTTEAAHAAMRYAFLHWGFHGWAIYALIGLSLAYFKFRKGSRGEFILGVLLVPSLVCFSWFAVFEALP